ncbi:MAG: DoxX family membrane protein [Muribaculaceae bacterium]|nr:DoxX family membrane protein [Muribaculaceae bacterium]
MQAARRMSLRRAAVWFCRLAVGLTFVISGWSKAIDPWGFIIKVNEYLTVWNLSFPREIVLTACVGLACIEFATGVLVATGSLKRASAAVAAAMMAVMLPLTLYIVVASPVSDCGCFGDFIVLSNLSTFIKNVILTGMIVYLLSVGRTVRGIYAAPIQWLVVAASLVFPLVLAFVGYNIQPVVDFRPYPVGKPLFGDAGSDSASDVLYIYEKDGRRRAFALDSLPDSTWTYVDTESGQADQSVVRGFEVLDEEGFDVSSDLGGVDVPLLLLVVNEPDMQFLSRVHFVNRLYEYASARGVAMCAIVGASGDRLLRWVELTRPRFPVYSAEDTALLQLVRGDAALVYITDGLIRWKRSLISMDAGLPERTGPQNVLDTDVRVVDSGRLHAVCVASYVMVMLVIYLLSLSPRILRFFVHLGHHDDGDSA